MLSFFPRGVLDEILNLIESVSEGFPSYSYSSRYSEYSTIAAAVQIFLSTRDVRKCVEILFFMLVMQDSHVIPAVSMQIFK